MAQPDLKVVWTDIDQTPEPFSFVRFLDGTRQNGCKRINVTP